MPLDYSKWAKLIIGSSSESEDSGENSGRPSGDRPHACQNLADNYCGEPGQELGPLLDAKAAMRRDEGWYPNEYSREKRTTVIRHGATESVSYLEITDNKCGKNFEDDILKKLKHAKTIKKLSLLCDEPSQSDNPDDVWDFTGFSDQLRKYLPSLRIFLLHFWTKPKNFNLVDLPIEHLVLKDPQFADDKFDLRLPNLISYGAWNTSMPTKALADSLENSPKLERLYLYKYWPQDYTLPTLYLPNCKEITIYRSDSIRNISIYMPRVKFLIIQANYELDNFEIIDKPSEKVAKFQLTPNEKPSKFRMASAWCGWSDEKKKQLSSMPRLQGEVESLYEEP